MYNVKKYLKNSNISNYINTIDKKEKQNTCSSSLLLHFLNTLCFEKRKKQTKTKSLIKILKIYLIII